MLLWIIWWLMPKELALWSSLGTYKCLYKNELNIENK